jgi:ubiquinone/menaquinone biosynthesis C-methylase UbiE
MRIKNYLNIFVLSILVLISNYYSFAAEENKDKVAPELINRAELFLSTMGQEEGGHVGGIDALIMMLAKAKYIAPNIINGNSLDVGSGFGADANFVYKDGFSRMWGMDINEDAVKRAQEQYPEVNFKKGDALKINDLFEEDFFDFVYLLNVASEIRDKPVLFQKLKVVCKPDSLIAILDFSLKDTGIKELHNLNGHLFYPINLEQLTGFLKAIDLEVVEVIDITPDYDSWYSSILSEISSRRSLSLAAGFTEEEIGYVETFLNDRLGLIKSNKIGGVLIFIRKV